MPDLAPDEQQFLRVMKERDGNARTALSPDENAFVAKMHRELPIAATGRGEVIPDWDARREALDTLTNGALSGKNAQTRASQRAWTKQNPELSTALRNLTEPTLSFLVTSGAGLAVLGAADAFGVPALGRFLTGTASGGRGLGGFATRLASRATVGAGQGALDNVLYPSDTMDTRQSAVMGAGINALTGGMIPHSAISSDTANLARRYIAQGMPLHTSQIPGAPLASRVLAKLLHVGRQDAPMLTRKMLESMGSSADALTQNEINAQRGVLGSQLDNIAQNAPAITRANSGIHGALANIYREAHSANGLLSEPDELRKIDFHLGNIVDHLNRGGVTGGALQAMTTQKSALSRLAGSNTSASRFAGDIKDALYDSLAQASPNDAQALSLARNRWRNSYVLENLLGNKNAVDTDGTINPKYLFQAVSQRYGNPQKASQIAAGVGNPIDIGTLAEGANAFKSQPGITLGGATRTGVGMLGALGVAGLAEHEGLPMLETALEHPELSLPLAAAGATQLMGGGLANTTTGRNMLLSRAASGNFPLFGGANPLIPLAHSYLMTNNAQRNGLAKLRIRVRRLPGEAWKRLGEMKNVLPRPARDFQHDASLGQDTREHGKDRVLVALRRGGKPLAVGLFFATLLEHRFRSVNDLEESPRRAPGRGR